MAKVVELKDIKELLDKSENPFFLFDEDCDGFCSYLLFKRYCKKGNGRVVKDSPKVGLKYATIANRFNPDLVIVLDKPLVLQEFVDNCKSKVVWVDHHPIVDIENVKYFNPKFKNPNEQSATTYWSYKCISGDKWLAAIGCVADYFIPDFIEDVKKEYPDLFNDYKTIEDLIYSSKFGKIIRILSFLLKLRTKEFMDCAIILEQVKDPYQILNFEGRFEVLRGIFEKINDKYENLLKKALINMKKENGFLWFIYPTEAISFTSELAQFLKYSTGSGVVLVGRDTGDDIKGSLRSIKINLQPIVKKALEDLSEGSYGGGHKNACGFNVKKYDWDKFFKVIKEEVKKCKEV